MIDPSRDIWVWATALLLFVVLGARAWVVETGRGRLGRTAVRVRVLTVASVVVLSGLIVLLAMQGGAQLVDAIVSGTDPTTGEAAGAGDPAAPDPAAPDPAAGDQGAVDPAAPDPAAPDPAGPVPGDPDPVPPEPAGG